MKLFLMIAVLQCKFRTIHNNGELQVGIKKEKISLFLTLKLLMNINLPLSMNVWPRNEKESDVVNREVKYHEIISHTVHKRSPGCLMWCLKKRILHPAQCHSYCTFSG